MRQLLRDRNHALALGGWANPHADAERQVGFLTAKDAHAEFYLTQVVSHDHADKVAREGLDAVERGRIVFVNGAHYRAIKSVFKLMPDRLALWLIARYSGSFRVTHESKGH